jgi:hypothetical protein
MTFACPHYGFAFAFRARSEAPNDSPDALWAAFIAVVESHGLTAGGGAVGTQWHHIISGEASQATNEDREMLLAWARSRADVVYAVAGPLIDLNAEPA